MTGRVQAFAVKKLQVKIFPNRREMGKAASQSVAEKMREILKTEESLSISKVSSNPNIFLLR